MIIGSLWRDCGEYSPMLTDEIYDENLPCIRVRASLLLGNPDGHDFHWSEMVVDEDIV